MHYRISSLFRNSQMSSLILDDTALCVCSSVTLFLTCGLERYFLGNGSQMLLFNLVCKTSLETLKKNV